MSKDSLFDKFVKTGKIDDYLEYRKKIKEDGAKSGTRKRNSTKNN